MIKIYRKTNTIKAEQFDGSKAMAKRYGAELYSESGYGYDAVEDEPDGDGYVLITPEGELLIRTGDWIATGVNGEHWPITDDVFKKSYAELPAIPQAVAKYIEMTRDEVMLFDALDDVLSGFGTLPDWISSNQDLFARAWLDGYMMEEEHD